VRASTTPIRYDGTAAGIPRSTSHYCGSQRALLTAAHGSPGVTLGHDTHLLKPDGISWYDAFRVHALTPDGVLSDAIDD